jgi:hypothetical protein
VWGLFEKLFLIKSYIFWDIMPCSPLTFQGTCHLHLLLHAGYLLVLFFDPEVGGNMFLEMIVDFQQSMQRYVPEGRTVHSHHCDNLKSLIEQGEIVSTRRGYGLCG